MTEKKIKVEPFTFKGESKEEEERFRHYLLGKAFFENLVVREEE